MKYFFLQIKEGPHGGPYYDCVDKWLTAGYAAVFTKESIQNVSKANASPDVVKFTETFKSKTHDDSILISIGEKQGIDTLYVYKKNGELEEIKKITVDSKNYKNKSYIDIPIGFKIELIKTVPIVKCPLVLAMIKSNIRLTMGTFKSIEDPKNPESHLNSYFGNIKALEYVCDEKKVTVDNFAEFLECLAPVEFETFIAKLMEEKGYFVPAYKGGMLKDYDLICMKKNERLNLQIKLNLSKDTYKKYQNKNLKIYCVTKDSKIVNPKIEIFDYKDIQKELADCPKTKNWLKQSLDWIDFNF